MPTNSASMYRRSSSIESWADFLHRYANGHFPSDQPIPLPPLDDQPGTSSRIFPSIPSKNANSQASFSADEVEPTACVVEESESCDDDVDMYDFANPVYSSVEISPAVATRVRNFYLKNNFLPPPRAPLEFLREQCIQEYEMYSLEQAANVQKATDLVQAFFGGIVTFTLFKHSQQELIAISGPKDVVDSIGLFVGKRLLPETSLCGHAILAKENIYIENLAKDWRYTGNPYCDDMKGVKSYVGSTVSLSVDPASVHEQRTVPVGVINLMHLDRHLEPLTPDQSRVMDHITRMLETQLRATWDGHRRTREARARRAISKLLEVALIQSSTIDDAQSVETPRDSVLSDPISNSATGYGEDPGPDQEEVQSLTVSASYAARQIKEVLQEVERVMVVDIQSIVKIKGTHKRRYVLESEKDDPFPLLAFETTNAAGNAPELPASLAPLVVETLEAFHTRRKVTYDRSDLSGFEPYLSQSTFTHLVIPFFSADRPLFLLVVASERPFYSFRASEINFIRSMGVVLRAKLVQSRVIEADAAKTAFLSSISHELRTPMHGVLSGVQLLREAVREGNVAEIEQIMKLTESSGMTLQSILNDVLDFGSLDRHVKLEGNKVTEADLQVLVDDTTRTCRPKLEDKDGRVDLLVDVEDRNWRVKIDSVGFQRILLNGLSNAIKFTQAGRITVTLRLSPHDSCISLQVRDTGPGLDPSFAARLFEPFTKADSFTPGAGLGLHISRTLAERMGGTVGLTSLPEGGALFEARLPVECVRSQGEFTSIHDLTTNDEPDLGILSSPIELSQATQDISTRLNKVEVSPKTTSPGRMLRVLIADDNEIALKILSTLLKRISKTIPLSVVSAKDGVEALELFQSTHPHLVLTDVSMPRMDGIQAACEMRRLEAESSSLGEAGKGRAKIYAITGLGSSDPRLRTESLRGSAALDGWLIKGQDKLSTITEIIKEASLPVQ